MDSRDDIILQVAVQPKPKISTALGKKRIYILRGSVAWCIPGTTKVVNLPAGAAVEVLESEVVKFDVPEFIQEHKAEFPDLGNLK